MARARNIKPGFFTNDILADCSPLARILFIGLWCLADREGRLEDKPKKIKAQILPYDNCDTDKLLNDLASKKDEDGNPAFIVRYKADGCSYIQIINFCQHQNPHIKEQASSIPAPDLHHTSTILAPDLHGSCPAESLLPITDSLLPITESPIPSIQQNTFADFWTAYPKKKSKGDAEKAWKAIKPKQELVDKIMEGLSRAKESEEWHKDGGQFIPYPASWLRAKGWEDEYTLIKPSKPKSDLKFYDPDEHMKSLGGQHD